MTTDEPFVSGASTDQHITGPDEEGTFTTDKPPTSHTPASGSSNRGINELNANREDVEEELEREISGQGEDR